MVVRVEMVMMEKNKRGGGEDVGFVVVVVVLLKMVKLSSEKSPEWLPETSSK